MKIKVENIEWDSDDIEDVADLETEITIDFPVDLLKGEAVSNIEHIINEFIEDEISNISGFTHKCWGKATVISA